MIIDLFIQDIVFVSYHFTIRDSFEIGNEQQEMKGKKQLRI